MPIHLRLASCLLLAALLCRPAAAADGPRCDRTFTLALHDHGLLYDSQTGEGIDRDMADALQRRSGCRFSVSMLPRARIWQLIESGLLDFSLSGISNPAREKFASFGWYFSNDYHLLVRRDAGVRSLADFERNPAMKLGVIRSFRYSSTANGFVDRLAAQGRVSQASALAPLYEVLLANRVQAMIIEPFDYPALQSERIRSQTMVLEFGDPPVPHGLIMSRAALAPDQQQAWRALIDALRADGTVTRIFEKYFQPELARQLTQF